MKDDILFPCDRTGAVCSDLNYFTTCWCLILMRQRNSGQLTQHNALVCGIIYNHQLLLNYHCKYIPILNNIVSQINYNHIHLSISLLGSPLKSGTSGSQKNETRNTKQNGSALTRSNVCLTPKQETLFLETNSV